MIKQINQLRKFLDANFTGEVECLSYEITKDEVITSGEVFVKQCYKHGFFRDFNLKVSTEDEFGFRLIVEYGYPPSIPKPKKWESNLKTIKPAKKPLKKAAGWNWVEHYVYPTQVNKAAPKNTPSFPLKPASVDWVAIEKDFNEEIHAGINKVIDEEIKIKSIGEEAAKLNDTNS